MPVYSLDGVAPDFGLDPGRVWIAPGAHVVGKVRLAEDVGVWFGAILRGDNEWIEVGAGTNIQENCIFHTDMGFPLTIGPRCTIGHGAILHGCAIGEESLIGMGAVVLNGARIGARCVVGAHALVTEGKVFEDGSLIVGSPARCLKKLDADAVARLREAAAHYVGNARRFSKGLVAIG